MIRQGDPWAPEFSSFLIFHDLNPKDTLHGLLKTMQSL